MLEVLKLVVSTLMLLFVISALVAFTIAGLKMMNTVWDVRYREQKIKLEAEDLQRREHMLIAGWEHLNEARKESVETRLAGSSIKRRSDSDPNLVELTPKR